MKENVFKIIIFVFYLVGMFFFFMGYTTPWWTKRGHESFGLFARCTKRTDIRWRCTGIPMWRLTPKETATLAVLSVAIFTNISAFISYIVTLCKQANIKVAAAFTLASGVLSFIGIVVYGSITDKSIVQSLGPSFIMTIIAFIVDIAVGIAAIVVDVRTYSK